jgi:hypothetical protein
MGFAEPTSALRNGAPVSQEDSMNKWGSLPAWIFLAVICVLLTWMMT